MTTLLCPPEFATQGLKGFIPTLPEMKFNPIQETETEPKNVNFEFPEY